MSAPVQFQVADRVRVIATGQTGSVVGFGDGVDFEEGAVVVLLDGDPLTSAYFAAELERYDGPPPVVVPPARPIRDGLPGVGDALLNVAAVLGAQLPANLEVQAKLGELKAAVEAAMPAEEVTDEQGNGWKKCGPLCDLAVVEPGRTECSGAGGCTR